MNSLMKYNGWLENSTKILSNTVYIREEFAHESIQEYLEMQCNINRISKKKKELYILNHFNILISKIILKNKKYINFNIF